ncbi:MAG: DctP family TRAP transporter solute-binding subunit [Lachnospiraceae bacterium]|nr:DctP family TRAP transporter solute-binding subunit [Lachnospiraceae bacterium]
MKKTVSLILVLALSVCMLAACGGNSGTTTAATTGGNAAATTTASEGKTYTLKIAHVMSEADPYHTGAQKFADLVTEKSGGRIKFEMYANAQLGGERDITEGVSMGTIECAVVTNAFCVNLSPDMGVLDFPYLFKSHEEAYRILDSEIGTELFATLEAHNIKGLAYMENGFRNLTLVDKTVTDPSEIKGYKIRTMETPVHLAAFNAAGANATPVAASELVTALQQGTVQGQENPLKSIYDYKFYEVSPYISMTEHFYSTANLIMNLNVWNSFSAEDQALIMECAKEATTVQREACAARNEEVKGLMLAEGVQIEENVDKDAWAAAMHPVYEDPEMIQKYGVYLEKIETALGR